MTVHDDRALLALQGPKAAEVMQVGPFKCDACSEMHALHVRDAPCDSGWRF